MIKVKKQSTQNQIRSRSSYTLNPNEAEVRNQDNFLSKMDTSQIGIIELNAAFTIVNLNQSMSNKLNMPTGKFIGKSILNLLAQENLNQYQSTFKNVISNNLPDQFDLTFYSNSKRLYTKCFASPIFTGAQKGVLLYVYELTEENFLIAMIEELDKDLDLRWAENELRTIERHYNLLFNTIPDGVCIMDVHGKILEWSKKSEQLYNYKKTEIINTYYQNILDQKSKKIFSNALARLKRLEIIEENINCISGYGRYVEIVWKAYPITDRNNKFSGILSYECDVTEKKRTEEILDLQSTALESVANSITITNKRGDIIWVNDAFCKMTGYKKKEVIYKNSSLLKSGKHNSRFYQTLWETILNKKVWKGEIINRKKNGELYTEEQTITPVLNPSGEILYFVSVKNDITQKIETEKREKLQQEQLQRADKMVALGTLVAGVAHEINNPNNFIMLNVPNIKKIWETLLPHFEIYFKENPDVNLNSHLTYAKIKNSMPLLLQGIDEGSFRIKNIVTELKDFIREDNKSFKENINVNNVIKAAMSLTKNIIKEHTKNLHVNYSRSIPFIKGNFQKLEQVIINLIENSCQAITDRNSAIKVSTRFVKKENIIIIEIYDEGCGIEKDILDKIQDPFFTTKRNNGGTGLGLSVSSKIINDHHGTLSFESVKHKWTKSIIKLPANRLD